MSEASRLARIETTDTAASRHRRDNRLLYAGLALVSAIYLAGLFYYALVRPIEADEGYYISAARLVWEGATPYRDFSYQQGFLLPYLYSWIWAIHPGSLAAMRLASAAAGACTVALWGLCLFSVRELPRKIALATFAVIVLNPYWVSWNVVVKTFAAANFLMSIAMICLYGALRSELRKFYFIGGLALGASAAVRSLYAPLLPLVLLWLLHREWRTAKWLFPKTFSFLGGAACGVLPMILGFVVDPQAFIFNNLQYRSLLNPHENFRHVIHGYLITLQSLALHWYLDVIVALAIVGGVSLWVLSRKRDARYTKQDYEYSQLAFLMLVVYVVVSWIPFPVYDQYFTSPLMPFLVGFIAEGLRIVLRFGRVSAILFAILVPIFFSGLKLELAEYSPQPAMQLASYRQVARLIEANSKPSDVVLSIWPGYVFASQRRYFPGSENHFNYTVGSKLSREDRLRYHVLSKEEVTNAVSSRAVDVFVSGWSHFHLESTMTPAELDAFRKALQANYLLVGTVDHVEVYRRR